MKAAIFNPYWDTLGGGERYTATFAKALEIKGWQVDIQANDQNLVKKLDERFGISLANTTVVPDIKRGEGYDLCFWLSDGSIPILHSRKNILHFQVPFTHINGKTLLNKMKLIRINKTICNSHFTKKFIDSEFGINSDVLYPPVSIDEIKQKRKENIILSVGRFSQLKQAKRQDVLISTFRRLSHRQKDWKLILAGGIEVGAEGYIQNLEREAKGYSIEIIKSPPYKQLLSLYGKAKIYWTASGFETDETENPEKVEHFGITVVEAMAAGCVPVAYDAGGHKEIITNQQDGYLWSDISQLQEITLNLINHSTEIKKISRKSISSSKRFSTNAFFQKVYLLWQ